ncbi:MAG: PAS domain S-box protein [Ignavibacteriales bacterium]|nr:PAS domain S-box protein [Ignavibacteriales bacterium]
MLLSTILNTAPIGIWMQDKDGKFLFVNDSFCNAVGVTEAQFLKSDHYSELLEADSSKQCMTSDKVAYGKEGPSVSYEKIRCADGKLHDLKVIKTRMVDEHLNLTGLVGISVDISELKQLEFQLKKAMETAESASRLKDAFLDNLSHELRTPLQGILGMTTIIQSI